MRRFLILVALSLSAVPAVEAHHTPGTRNKVATLNMPVTTSSAKARDLFERGMVDYENMKMERANIGWRAAAKEDPDFALAEAWVAFNSRDPQEASAAREKAKSLAAKVSPGERLMINWIANVQEGNYINGIAAMNDLLDMYPKDKRLYFLAANWLMGENGYQQAQRLLEQSLAIDKDYPAALNDLGYSYAKNRQFDQAFATMERYIAALPGEPNPHDSYAEILRMAGNFDGALEHYRASLKVDPDFITSQLGIADTYALMGDENRARAEYDKAIAAAHNPADRLDYIMQTALTWVREKNFDEADKLFLEVTNTAHNQELSLQEAQGFRRMAEYQPDDLKALNSLDSAEAALFHNATLSQAERDEEMSRILRYRVVRAGHAGKQELAGQALFELQTMATGARNLVIQSSYHGAAGAALMQAENYLGAVSELEEDRDEPESLQLLMRAYQQIGATDKEHEVEVRLRGTYLPTLEQALVVPAVKAQSSLTIRPTL